MTVLSAGTVIDRYVIRGEIGSGSMGDVLRGEDEDLKRPVAIKILSERHRENKELRARFVREARAVAAISHPNVVQVFTTGTFDDRPYIAMELLKGVDLGSVIKDRGVMSSVQAAKAVLDSAKGLDAAAKAGLIHRDVKPSNLVLVETGEVKVTDFGLAKPLDPSTEPALTAMGVVVGTPDYIAPEQARGDPIDERVDIYALGGTLFFLLTGTPPYRKGNPIDDKYLKVVARHLKDPVPSARNRNKSADRALSKLGSRLMAKSPDERPDYPELIDQLTAIIARLEKGGASTNLPAVTSQSSRSVPEPTPFVGSKGVPEVGGRSRRASSVAPSSRQRRATTDAPFGASDENAQTMVRPSAKHSTYSDSLDSIAPPRRSVGLILLTGFAVILFLAGLALMIFGPLPQAEVSSQDPTTDATQASSEVDAAPAKPPTPPEGMILVTRGGGQPWFFVDAKAVRYRAFSKIFPKLKKPSRSKRVNDAAVVSVRYKYVRDFANASRKRLLTPEEWTAAARMDGFETSGKLWEWVDEGAAGTQSNQSTMQPPNKLKRRRNTAHKGVTFRLGQELPQ